MTSSLFESWFFNNFATQVESYLERINLPRNAVLLLDNAPCHPPAEELVKETRDGKIWVLYMPPNVTPLIQRMDQNAIRLLKLYYKNSLLSRIFSKNENDVMSFLKNFTLYEAMSLIALAWKSISESALAKCWNNLLNRTKSLDEDDDLPLSILLRQDEQVIGVSHGVQLLNSAFPNNNLSYDDMNRWVDETDCVNLEYAANGYDDAESDTNGEDNIPSEEEPRIKHDDVVKHFEICIKWGQQNNIDATKSLILRELQEEAIQKKLFTSS